MKSKLMNFDGAKVLTTKEQKVVVGGNCRMCYANNGGAYNSSDPNCWGCDWPVMH